MLDRLFSGNIAQNILASLFVFIASLIGTFAASTLSSQYTFERDTRKEAIKDAQNAASEAVKLLFDSEDRLSRLYNSLDDKQWKDFSQQEWKDYMDYFSEWRHDVTLSYFHIQQYFGQDLADGLVNINEEFAKYDSFKTKEKSSPKNAPDKADADTALRVCSYPGKPDLLKIAQGIECDIRMLSLFNEPGFPDVQSGKDDNTFERTKLVFDQKGLIDKNINIYDINILNFIRSINVRLKEMGQVRFEFRPAK